MISLLPVASHFDISRKPKDRNRHSHRQSINPRDNDKCKIKADDSKSASSFNPGRPSLSSPHQSSPPLQGGDVLDEASAVNSAAHGRANEKSTKSPRRTSRLGSGPEDGNGSLSRMSSVGSVKRLPSTDSDLYTSSLTDRNVSSPQKLGRFPSSGSQQSAKSSHKRKSSHSSMRQEGDNPLETTGSPSDQALTSSHTEGIVVDLPLVESPAVGDTTQSSAVADATISAASSANYRPQIVSQTTPATQPPTQGSSIHMGSTQHPNAPYVRPRSSTAQVSRASPPFESLYLRIACAEAS